MCQAAERVNEFVMFNCPTPTTFNGPYFIFQFVHLRKLTTSFNNFLNSCKHFIDTDGATEGGCDKIYTLDTRSKEKLLNIIYLQESLFVKFLKTESHI